MTDQQRINNLLGALSGVVRARANQIANALGLRLASGSASLASMAIVAFLAFHLLLLLNIGLAFWLSDLTESSPAVGFFALAGIYLLLLGGYWLLRHRTEQRVRDRVARYVTHQTDNLNTALSEILPTEPSEHLRQAYISGEPQPYHALELRHSEARRVARRAMLEVKEEFAFVRANYVSILGGVAHNQLVHRYPAYRYVAPVVESLAKSSQRGSHTQGAKSNAPTGGAPSGRIGRAFDRMAPYLPYVGIAFNALKPVLTAFAVGQLQGWLLGGLNRIVGKRSRRK